MYQNQYTDELNTRIDQILRLNTLFFYRFIFDDFYLNHLYSI